jgi:hypothetical protein
MTDEQKISAHDNVMNFLIAECAADVIAESGNNTDALRGLREGHDIWSLILTSLTARLNAAGKLVEFIQSFGRTRGASRRVSGEGLELLDDLGSFLDGVIIPIAAASEEAERAEAAERAERAERAEAAEREWRDERARQRRLAEAAEQEQGAAPPEGWSRGISRSTGRTYYVNDATGKSQWNFPDGAGGARHVF